MKRCIWHKHKGAILMMTLLVIFIVSLIAATLMSKSYLQISLLENRQSSAQLDLFNKGVIDWVKVMLWVDQRRRTPTTLEDVWAIPLDHTTVYGGVVTGRVQDAQALWNCNNLVYSGFLHESQVKIFEKLLGILNLPTELAATLAQALLHNSFGHYRQPHSSYLLDISELSALPGFSDDVISKLRPYVTALPGYTKVNVNTAPQEVLAAVISSMDMRSVQHLVARRIIAPFSNFQELGSFLAGVSPSLSNVFEDLIQITLKSDYFLITGFTEKDDTKSPMTALIRRHLRRKPYVVWFKRS
ncbi:MULTISPECIES: type II secretion system minor pseudopilin GspK [Candidatus Ichthyocystis]|uniref:Type II secretion system protein K n=1 Tax=Candidatus Ichthyocystis hellenicum TaxID=1561003 RepID=A0A0S4M2X1_9BURK|nr:MULTISPECIES: type II secretion system minor pseudopilin GspK [Ichthyocystis]CUT17218.1 putative type II secretion system protein K [Candidatus Ichthyocystis hellenicum]